MGTLLLGPVDVGLHVKGEAGLQHVFYAKRTEDSGLLPSILATNLHVRDEVMLLNHLMTNVARKHAVFYKNLHRWNNFTRPLGVTNFKSGKSSGKSIMKAIKILG